VAEEKRSKIALQRERLMDSLRDYGAEHAELSRHFAVWLGLHSTDADALLEIVSAEERGAPLSPARLSERILLSSGATTALLNRLEAAGYVVRSREQADRRVVTLRSNEQIRKRGAEFFDPLAEELEVVMARYPHELIEQFEALVGELSGALAARSAELAARRVARRREAPRREDGGSRA
jgi:DNA-binding MarR family transcriptional regulator